MGFYVPFGVGLCLKLEIENCELPTVDRSESKCLRCAKDHIFDTTTNKCKKVATLIQNCDQYDSSANCQLCSEGFFLDNKACTAVASDKVVTNCMAYETTNFTCLYCKAGFFLNTATKACDSIPSEDNCIAYTQNKCLSCATGYIKDENFKLSLSYDTSFMKQVVMATVDGESQALLVNANLNDCKKTTVLHCAEFETFEKCLKCEAAYFLTDSGAKCTLLPQEPIKNCLTYADATTCITCVNGAYKDGNDCKASTIVESCKTYSQSEDKCTVCEYGYYLDSSACHPREKTKASVQCKELNQEKDECLTCNPNFTLNTDKNGCLAIIPDCDDNAVDVNNNITCTKCLPGYGKDNAGLCQKQEVEHCKTHTTDTLTCDLCDPDYYTADAGKKCLPNTVENCKVKSTTANECETCNEYFFKDASKHNSCSLQNIDFCETFTVNENVCTKCMEGFFPNDPASITSCTKYTLVNCKTPNPTANLCDDCELNYYKDDNADGGCSRQSRPDCIGYELNKNICKTCNPGYFLDDTDPAATYCKKKEKSHCKEYDNTNFSHDQCKTCNVDYYVDNSGDCQPQTLTVNCIERTSNVDTCNQCANLYFIDSGNSNKCSKIAAFDNCVTSDGKTDACTVCKRSFYLDSGKCKSAGAMDQVDTLCAGNKHTATGTTCTECPKDHTRFIVSAYGVDVTAASNAYTNYEISKCLSFSSTADTCSFCKEGYDTTSSTEICKNKDTAKSCLQKISTAITESFSDADKCNKCNDDYYETAANAPADNNACTIRTNKSLYCESGSKTKDADSCDMCQKNSHFGTTNDFSICMKDITGTAYKDRCQTVNIDDPTACLSCTMGPDASVATDCATALPTDGTMYNHLNMAIELTAIKTAAADQSNNCHASKYYGTDYHLGISCAVCADDKFRLLKIEDSGNSDSTVKINGQTFIGSQAVGTNEVDLGSNNLIKIVPFTNIPASDGGCYTDLENDFKNRVARVASSQAGDKRVMKFDPDADPKVTVEGYYTDANDTDQYDPDNTGGFLGTKNKIMDPTNTSDPNYGDFNTGDPTDKGPLYYDPTDANTKKIKYYIEDYDGQEDGTFSNPDKYGYILEVDANLVVPISCKKGFKPTFTSMTQNSEDGKSTSATISTKFSLNLTDCTAHSTTDFKLNKRFEGLGYGSASVIPLEALIQYDSCILDSELFFFSGEIITNTASAKTDLGFAGSTLFNVTLANTDGNQHCIPKMATDGDLHEIIENCQVNLKDDDDTTAHKGAKATFDCISCKPGYKPTYDASGVKITACTVIENCDISNDANNTWMNMCQTCKSGYSWVLDVTNFNVELDACMENTVDHCLVFDKTPANGCSICERGYNLTTDAKKLCVAMEITKCKEYNFHNVKDLFSGNTALAATDIDKLKNVANFNAFMQWAAYGATPQYKSGCNVCETGHKPAAGSGGSTNYCLGTSMTGTAIADCEYYDGTTAGKCKKCIDTHLVEKYKDTTDKYRCVTKTDAEKYCLEKDSTTDSKTDGTTCTTCVGFRNPVSNACKGYLNCDIVESATPFKCERCKEGYRPTSDGFDCEPIPSNDVCQVYLKDNICIKCKDSSLSPVNLTANDVTFRVNCVTKYDDKLSTGSVNKMYTNNVYVIDTTTTTTADRFVTKIVYQPVGQYEYSEYMSSGANPKVSVCLASPMVDHCKTYDQDGFRKCTACNDGYKLNSTDHTCIDGTIDNCIEYSGDDCAKCHKDYFLETVTKCTKRNNSNCKTFFASKDNCVDCFSDQYYKAVSTTTNNVYGLCHQFTEENCKTPSTTANECTACIAKQRYLDGGKCKLYTKKYCEGFNISEDKCTACNPDRWLSSTTFECEEYTAKNCSTYSTSADECTGCKEGFFSSGNTCLPPAAKFCLTRKTTADECEECEDGYWKNGTVCEENTAVNCRTKSKTANQCTDCEGGNYMESNVCKPHDVEFCSVFTSNANTCDICATGYYTDGGQCKLNTTVFCTVKSGTENKCVTCNDKYYADTNGLCEPVTNVTCVTIKSNTNECETCLSTRYKDIASGECKELTVVENCMTYEEEANQCKICKTGFYKSTDSLACFPNPNGILGCTTYSDLTTCTACRKTHFLENNTCKELTQTAIDFCATYSGDGTCATCDAGYSLDGAACAANVETSCLTWTDKDTCATCNLNEILESGKCVATAITGCAQTSGAVGSETCLKCSGTTYLDANECKTSATTVPDCVEYSGDGICKMCSTDKVVSSDGSACVTLDKGVFGPNCASGSTNSTPICAMCTDGYLMDSQNKCSVSCSAANCMICDPNNVEKCNLCKTGYHMTSDLVCEENNQTREFVGILRGFGMIALLLLAMWK